MNYSNRCVVIVEGAALAGNIRADQNGIHDRARFFMSDITITTTVTVVNPHGIHLRPADLFARTANKFQAKVTVNCDDQTVDGKSIVDMLMLAARAGKQISIRATGHDAQEVINALVELVQNGFGEMEESAEA